MKNLFFSSQGFIIPKFFNLFLLLSMQEKDIRWLQRFSNFNKALQKLKEAVDKSKTESLTELEKEGLIQRFEYTYELAWKTLQDLIKHKGYEGINGPNPVLTQAFQINLIHKADSWKRLNQSRQLTSHTYDSETANDIVNDIINEYFDLFADLQNTLEQERSGSQNNLFD